MKKKDGEKKEYKQTTVMHISLGLNETVKMLRLRINLNLVPGVKRQKQCCNEASWHSTIQGNAKLKQLKQLLTDCLKSNGRKGTPGAVLFSEMHCLQNNKLTIFW